MRNKNGQFEKGVSGNPFGQNANKPAELVEARKLNRDTATMLLTRNIYLNLEEIGAKFRDPKTPAIELIILKVIEHAIKYGDHHRLNFFLDRIIGKVPDSINVEGGVKPFVMKLFGEDAAIVIQGAKDEDNSRDR